MPPGREPVPRKYPTLANPSTPLFREQGDDDAYEEFMSISKATAQVVGKERIFKACDILEEQVDAFPKGCMIWGVEYLMQFL